VSTEAGIREAYSGDATTWAAAPAVLYRRFATAMVADCPVPLAHAAALDVGAGTGVASELLRGAGARVVVTDFSFDMLRARPAQELPAVVGDVRALPIAPASFDVAVAAFVLNHLDDPGAALAEMGRAVRPAGAVLAEVFDTRWDLPAKRVVEETARRFGFVRPDWYRELKEQREPLTARPERLDRVARDAGLVDVVVATHEVDTGLRTAEDVIAWRLSTPAYASFMRSLPPKQRSQVVEALVQAFDAPQDPIAVGVLVLAARTPGA
jgi:ubiquinone/menaquinone biosynthesis C-methylase UbiE